jgi:flagellar hook assembly protein FlgD/Tol biopolymer transport system component
MNGSATKRIGDLKGIGIAIAMILSLVIPPRTYAADFTARSLADYGNVTVMEVSGNYDADNPDGTVNAVPRQVIAKEFFRTHKDEYDFLVIFTNFDFQMPAKEVQAFYEGVRNDALGIGVDMFDNTSLYGSNGKLQGTIDMGSLSSKVTDPLDPKFEETLSVLGHEMMHRWAARARFKDANGAISSALLGHDGSHWSFLLDTAGSVMYGNKWKDNGNGTFTTTTSQGEMKLFSPLDLYLMGMIDKSKVPPMLLINSPDTDASQLPQAGVTVTGTAQYVTIDQIIAAMGPRIPDAASSQKNFKSAFIFITQPGTFRGDEVYGIENVRNGAITRFSILTDGQAIMQVAPTLQDNIPMNPGILPPSPTPRTTPPNLNEGVQWLMAAQQADGSWQDLSQTRERDTAQVVPALKNFGPAQQHYQAGLAWLSTVSSGNLDYLARKIEALATAGQDTGPLVQDLLARRNADGGWGSDAKYPSTNADTALALKALSTAGYTGQSVIAKAVELLKTRQNADGGWGGENKDSMVRETAVVLSVLNRYRTTYQVESAIANGAAWLISRQNADGGFGNSPSTVYDTATAAMTLRELSASDIVTSKALGYIQGQQAADGSWNGSVYQTALAVEVVYQATIDPDLSIRNDDIAIVPGTVTTLPTNAVISATIWNLGMTAVPQAKVALYDGDLSAGNKLGEQTLSFLGQQAVAVTFSIVVNDGNEHLYTIVADPDNQVKDSNRLNNKAVKLLTPTATYDFEVLAQNITISSNPANILQDVQFSAQITNKGTMNAYNVQVMYFIDDPGAPFEIATQTVDIPAGATVTSQATWRANRAGVNMPLAVQVDPFNTFTEISKTNNKASATLTVNADTRPNLSVSYKDLSIAPVPVNQGGNATLTIVVKNDGFSPASNVTVRFYEGVPGLDGVLLGSQVLLIVNPGDAVPASISWVNISDAGEKIVYVKVDPDNQVQEIRKDDNDAFITVDILSLPDLAVSTNSIILLPAAPKEGDPASIMMTVQNRGDQAASNVVVRLSEGDLVLGNPTIPAISGHVTGTVTLSYDTTGKKGSHTIVAVVDPANAIAEQRKDNNTASRTFGVQDANLWVTEPYLSPNGDGIKDSTQLFFRLDTPRTVTVNVVNEKSEIVRTFSGPELANISEGNITWDGMNNDGMVVRDGTYNFRINDENNAILGTLPVTMDTNRSPLADAFGTKYLLNNNLTCMLPDLYDWKWIPDESGILISMPYSQDTPEYPTGLYILSPDGQDIQRIVPALWTANTAASCNQRPADNPCIQYTYSTYAMSPDSENVAFILRKEAYQQDPYYWWWWGWYAKQSQLWVTDRYGKNLVMLDSYDDVSQTSILDFSWSPSGNALVYRVQKPDTTEELWYAGKDGAGKRLLDSGGTFDFNYLRWSPDGGQLAYAFGNYDANGNYAQRIRITDLAGTKQDVFTVNDPSDPNTSSRYADQLEWLGGQKIALSEGTWSGYRIWIVDASGNGNHVSVSEQAESFSIVVAPNRQSFAFAETNYSWNDPTRFNTTKVSDAGGTIVASHSLASNDHGCWPDRGPVAWSQDSRKIVFWEYLMDAGEGGGICADPIGPRTTIIDINANKDTSYDNTLQPLAWLSDGVSIAGSLSQDIYSSAMSFCVMNSQNGQISCVPLGTDMWLPSDIGHTISPHERYFNYYRYVDSSSICYGRAYNNLWAMSSLLNLTADLRMTPGKSAVILKGIASDLNFDSYQLEYADAKTPSTWSPIAPPSNVPVVNDVFTTWVPPYEGTFYVRLTAQDKAGNADVNRKRVSWGITSSITNIYKTLDIFSPNNDGVKDTVELHYTILEPVHLEFGIYDASGAVVRMYPRDYPVPGSDFISWDGRDSSGNVVPDGNYQIRILDYTFFVAVDTTPPDVNVLFSSLGIKEQESCPQFDAPKLLLSDTTKVVFSDLKGHAADKNLKSWTIEYGQGDNPSDWTLYGRGADSFIGQDEQGNALEGPAKELPITRFKQGNDTVMLNMMSRMECAVTKLGQVEWLAGKKFRITAEDYAGNKSTVISDFLEQKLILHSWDGAGDLNGYKTGEDYRIDDQFYLYVAPYLATPGVHTLRGFSTYRAPLADLLVQHSPRKDAWSDSPPMSGAQSGEISVQWDASGLGKSQYFPIRIQGTDPVGQAHVSNMMWSSDDFEVKVYKCATSGGDVDFINVRANPLRLLRLQVKSDQDTRYLDWTDFKVYEVAKGDLVPTGHFSLQEIDLVVYKQGMTYQFRMLGEEFSGQPVSSNESTVFPELCVKVKIHVDYDEADCGSTTSKAVIASVLDANGLSSGTPKIALQTLKYDLKKPDGTVLLRQIDLARESWDGVTVDTSAMPEGRYTVSVQLSYEVLNTTISRVASDSDSLIVDRVLPTAKLTYPAGTSQKLCAMKFAHPLGDWFGIPVEGVAADNTKVRQYKLFYKSGSETDPDPWKPATYPTIDPRSGRLVHQQIEGRGPVEGRIGTWDVSKLPAGTYSLKLAVTDVVGNTSCSVATFSVDTGVEAVITDQTSRVISPNGDDVVDTVTVNYEINKNAIVEIRVYKATLSPTSPAGIVLDTTPVRTIASAIQYLGGTGSILWDGKNDGGGTVPDGLYGVAIVAKDACGNTSTPAVARVEVDTTQPSVAIAYPQPGNPLGNIVEVRGSANDLHFQRSVLEVGEGGNPDFWGPIATSPVPVSSNVLGKWNTFALQGTWTIRLTALDTVGNKSVTTSVIDLGMRQNLIKDLSTTPRFFSPNHDNILDTTTVQYELTDACSVKIEFVDALGAVRRTTTASAPSLGVYTFVWDGKDGSGQVVVDGVYTVRLTATLASNASITQTEMNTVVVDTTLPTIDIKQPADGSYLKTDVTVTGSITDDNLKEYSLTNSGNGTSLALDSDNQNRLNYVFGTMSGLAEGGYTLAVKTSDQAGNAVQKNLSYTIDRTPPAVKLDTPKDGEYYGANKNITISGGIVEKNLDTFELRYGLGDAPAQWTDLVTGTTVTAYPPSYTWKVGKNDNVPDGLYLVSLFAKDKAGWTGEAKAKITIDNTPPTAAVTSLHDGDYVKQAVDVKGTAFDQNLDKYTLEISEGQCVSAYKWVQVKTGTASVQDNSLGMWQALPADGDYCLRLSVLDKVGLTAEVKVNVKVDTHPPAAPVLSGKTENKTTAHLTWTGNTESDLAGYNLYRAGQKVNASLITDITYLDQNLSEGVYAYTVKAQDLAGWESPASNEVKITIDLTGPNARINAPQDGARVSGLIDIKGTAYSADDFKQYRVSVGQGATPSAWTLIRTSPVPVSYGVLSPWDTLGLAEGQIASLKLEAEDLSGNVTTHQVSVTIDNLPPAAPLLVAASAVVSDVTITWKANTEADLAGYLLYRNDQLANVTGIVVGNMQPYLIKDTTYVDRGRPDGTFTYYVIAVDEAGNMSGQSNTLEVTIDTRPPHAAIVDPQDRAAFETKTMVKAESPDQDIASVQFQYQGLQDASWSNLGSAVTGATIATYLDPVALGLTYGDYRLRAVATDKGNKTDPTPGFITVTYTDLTPPAVPTGVAALVTGGSVTLTWNANTETDLGGYNVYRDGQKINTTIVTSPAFQDQALADGSYAYTVTAVDTHNNESKPSSPAVARIYAPVIAQPYTPANQSMVQVQGTNATANATVSLYADTASGLVSVGTATAEPTGTFAMPVTLSQGENWLAARVMDSAGNTSKDSSVVVVVYDIAPGAPTNAAAAVNGPDVHLTWDPNPEPTVLGYNVFRNGVKLNGPAALDTSPATFNASSSVYPYYDYYLPYRAVDGWLDSYWMPESGVSADNPAWWEMDLPSPELINHVELHWGADVDGSGNPLLYAGKDYEIQVWSGYAWITQVKVTGNAVKDNLFDFKPPYRTDKIRIFITDSTDNSSMKEIRLAEVNVVKDNPIVIPAGTQPSYDDLGMLNRPYDYTLTAVDAYGFESLPTSTVSAVVSSPVPTAPMLTATAINSDIMLSWAAATGPGIAGYNVYKYTGQGWTQIASTDSSATAYLDAALPNGTYTYRITVLDSIGNESASSNDASATVFVAPPAAAVNLGVTPTPEGGLNAAWIYNGSPVAGYNLYRSLTTGGPYARVNSGLIGLTNYLDTGLLSGVTYFYVVTAVDPVGNEGSYSNEASGTPSITAVPSKPVLFFPTVAGLPVTIFTNATDVSGSSVPGSAVLLIDNGTTVGTATALSNDDVQSSPVDFDGNAAVISPDGKTLAYTSNGAIMLKTLATGSVRRTELSATNNSSVWSMVWSPDGKKIAYTNNYYIQYSYWVTRIYILDVESGVSTLLTAASGQVYEDSPSWSPDGRSVAYTTDDPNSPGINIIKLTTGETTQIVATYSAGSVQFSPDGKKLAYFDNGSLYLTDLTTGESQLIDDNVDTYWLAWSPDGAGLAFVSYRNGNGDVVIYVIASGNQALVPGSSPYPYYLSWTADSRYVLFGLWDSQNDRDSLWKADVRVQSQPLRIMPDLRYVYYYAGARSGSIAAIDQNVQGSFTALLLNPAGNFTLSAVSLVPGENIFTATASNNAGKISDPSDAIFVTFDTSLLPDLAVSAGDIYLYPPYPIAGEQMSVNAVVWNTSQVDASKVDVLVYAWNAKGQLELLASQTVPTLPAGSSTVVTVTWNSTGKAGTNRLVVVVDPYDTITESNESNNMAIKDFYVADHAGMSLTTATDSPQYSSNRNVNITVTAWNTGPAANAILAVRIEDANSYPVTTFDDRQLSLAYAASSAQAYAWNTGTTFAGPYRVHAVLKDLSGNTLAEQTTPFTILSDAADDLSLSTDRLVYSPQQNVVTSYTIKNSGTNSIIPALQATVSISDAAGAILFTEVKTATNLLPGASINLSSLWNTGLSVPGKYTATVEASFDGGQPVTRSAAFTIQGTVALTGSVTASPEVVAVGNSAEISYALGNTGNLDAQGYTLRVSILDPVTQTVMQTLERSADIAANTATNGQFTVSTAGYGLKTYAAVLQAVSQGTAKTIASTSFAVKDLTPPVVTVLSPAADSTHNAAIAFSASASDDASGVNRVEYRLDNGVWSLLAVVDPSQARYGTSWEPTAADNGPHTVSFRATDKAGNTGTPVSVSFAVQISAAAPTAVITGTPSSPTNATDATLAVGGTDVVVYRYKLDSGAYSPETVIATPVTLSGLSEGDHTVWVVGRNAAGIWQAEENATLATWTVDITPPALSLSTLPDGSYTNNAVLNVAGTTSDTSGIQSIVVSGQSVTPSTTDNVHYTFSYAVTLATGSNTITTVATDNAGNTTVDTRTIILDQTAPKITIITPADNSVVSSPTITVSGTTDTIATVLISLNSGPTVTAAINAMTFSLPVTLATNTVNNILVYATDLANNTGTDKRTVTHDDISPGLAVTYPAQDITTNQAGILLRGTVMDTGATTVTITFDGTTSAPAIANGSFEQQLTFTEEKQYQAVVTATDAAGNSTTVQRNIIYDKTPPGLTIDPVTTPTNVNQQLVTGTREANAAVTVSCDTADVGVVSYPSSTTWQVTIEGMNEGANTLSATAADHAGNVSNAITAVIVLDTTAPVTTAAPAGGIYAPGLSAVLSANEPATIYYTVDGTEPILSSPVASGPIAIAAATTLQYFAVDLAGNREPVKSTTYVIDSTPPSTTITIGEPKHAGSQGTVFVSGITPFSLAATDDLSGVMKTEYRIDNGPWIAAATFSITSEGQHTIDYYSKDVVSNTETVKTLTVYVDTTPPASVITAGAPQYQAEGNLYVSGSTPFSLAATDDLSGVMKTEYRIDNGPWIAAATFSITSEGSHLIGYRGIDTVNNTETGKTLSVIVDAFPPTVSVTAPVADALYNVTVPVRATAVDSITGVDRVEYQADGGAWLALTAVDPASGAYEATWAPGVTQDDYHTIVIRAWDRIGTTSAPIAITFFLQIEKAPTAPSLSAPANGSDVETLTPVLTVNNASDPNGDPLTYEFELYADSGLTQLVTSSGARSEGAGVTTWMIPNPLTENQIYYWRSRAFDGKLYGPWMERASFRVNVMNDPPTAPVPLTPANNTETSLVAPVLTVTNATDPDSPGLTYNFQVALDPDFSQIVTSFVGVPSGGQTTAWQVPTNLGDNAWYYWRAQADDWLVEGPWSATSRFFVNTSNDAPTAPSVLSPANGSTITTTTPDIVLQNSTDPDSPVISYTIELDVAPTFNTPKLVRADNLAPGQGTTVWTAPALLDNTRYYARAKASDGQADSLWSATNSFFVNTANDPPTTPVPANPSNGAGVGMLTPTLSVYNATDVDGDALTYEFELYADAAMTMRVAQAAGIAETAQTTFWTVPVLLTENRTYYWHARAFDGQLASNWTALLSFTVNTGNDAPGAPGLVAPAMGSSVTTLTPTLTVTNAVDPDSSVLTYEFEVYTGSVLVQTKTGVPQGANGTTSVTLSTALTDNTTYQWRARAFDGTSYGPWMAMATFTVHLPQTGITVEIEVEPETLNKKSHGNWVMVEIELPHGYRAEDVDISSIRLEGIVPAVAWPHEKGKRHHEHGCEHDHDRHDHSELKVKFRRSDVIAVLPVGNHVPVHVTGTVAGIPFEGVDIIKVIH